MLRRIAFPILILVAGAGVAATQACRGAGGSPLILGAEARLGDGVFTSYVELDEDGAPTAIGLVFPSEALNTLPTARSDEHRCHDLNGNGAIDPDAEWLAFHERVIPLPSEVARRDDIPFSWILLNWNPEGHLPPEIYTTPHFDVHYMMQPIEEVFAIMPGPCGDEHVRCDPFGRAVVPVPERYMHRDFQDVGAVVPAMGNHLVDLSGHECHGQDFDRAWTYGAYDGRITFWEEMVTRAFLLGRPDTCFDIKTPDAVAVSAYYPTRSCYGHSEETGEQRVSLEEFVYREGS